MKPNAVSETLRSRGVQVPPFRRKGGCANSQEGNQRIQGTQQRHRSVLDQTAEALKDVDRRNLERIQPFCLAPWQPRPQVRIEERERAIQVATGADFGGIIFTDASSRRGKLAIGVTYQWPVAPRTISKVLGCHTTLGVHHAELMGIEEACRMMETDWPGYDIFPRRVVTIFSDSQSALQALADPRQQSGQMVLRIVSERLEQIKSREDTTMVLRWVPGHTGVPGNEHAHQLAQKATDNEAMPISMVNMKSIALKEGARANTEARKRFAEGRTGRHTKTLDRALPGAHTEQLYDGLKREDAKILAQLRTGWCGLNHYLYRIKGAESAKCEVCQRLVTVRHFLVECRRWTAERRQNLQSQTSRWSDMSYVLGGWLNARLDGPRERWKANMSVVKATIRFAEATGRLSSEYGKGNDTVTIAPGSTSDPLPRRSPGYIKALAPIATAASI